MRAFNSFLRALSSSFNPEIKLVSLVTKALAFSFAALQKLIRSSNSVQEHPGDKVLASRLVNIVKVFMSRESILSEISSAATFVVSASAISASTDSIFSHVAFILVLRSSSEAVVTSRITETASMLVVGPVEAEDVVGMLVKGVDEVKRVERLFAGFQANWAPDNQAPG